MKSTTATIYGAKLLAHLLFGRPYGLVPNTTLNERHDVQAGIAPTADEQLKIGYLQIGNGGHRNAVGADNHPYTSPNWHLPSDASCFKPIPFVLRRVDNDLTPAEQSRYALRKLVEVDGVYYWAYFLRRLDVSNVTPQMLINTVGEDGVVTSRPFVPNSDNLNPTPTDISPEGSVTSSGEYLTASATVEVVFSAAEIEEIIEACRILYDNEGYAVISEMAIVAGCDRIVTANGPGNTTFNFNEALAATVISFLTTYHNLPAANNGITEILEMGTTEAMLLTTAIA